MADPSKTKTMNKNAGGSQNHHRILVIHENVPRPDRSGCDARLVQLLREFMNQGHSVTLIGRQSVESEPAEALRRLGVKVFANDMERLAYLGHTQPIVWTLQQVLSEGNFSLAILFQWYWWGISIGEHYIDEIRNYSPGTRIAILSDDRHGLRENRLANITQSPVDLLRAENIEHRELEVLNAADLILGITEADVSWFRKVSNVPCDILPMSCAQQPPQPGYEGRSGVLFIGDFTNRANVHAIDWLLREVWPKCRMLSPDIRLHLVGNALATHSNPEAGIEAVGYVEDLNTYFRQARVFIAPIRYCTGIQTKSLAAIVRGLPLVTTITAAEGLRLSEETGAIATDDPVAFAESIVRLHSNARDWQRLSSAGRTYAEHTFSEDRLRRDVSRVLSAVHAIQPKTYDPSHEFSIRKVEREYSECTAENDMPSIRLSNRVRGYLDLAESSLYSGDKAKARHELLQLFAYTNGTVPPLGIFSRAFLNLAGLIEDQKFMASQYVEIAANTLNGFTPERTIVAETQIKNGSTKLEISVVIPTFNRAPTLASCLAELSRQSLDPSRFEVIVIDDGSTDATQEFCNSLRLPYPFRYYRQKHGGTGSARRTGVRMATGKYVLFLNDDSISAANLLEEHLQAQRSVPHEKCWVLGWFGYSHAASRRALTYFLSTQPFLFPQSTMSKGTYQGAAYFITCNLSIRRDALVDVGSFDPDFCVAEDTELGTRLEDCGYEAFYWPEARALHDHLNFRADDLMRRARQYGEPTLRLLKKHPRLLADGNTPFGLLDSCWIEQTRSFVKNSKRQADEALAALRRFDNINFRPMFSKQVGEKSLASEIQDIVQVAAMQLHWFYLFESMLETIESKNLELASTNS